MPPSGVGARCGLTYIDRFKFDYDTGCNACRDPFIQFYYNIPCNNIPERAIDCESQFEVCEGDNN